MATEKRLIDANDVSELLEKEFVRKWRLVLDGETHLDNLAEGFFSAKSVIWAMPTVEAVEVVHGRWVVEHEESIRCSKCCFNRASIKMPMDYCPNCGADMRGNGNV